MFYNEKIRLVTNAYEWRMFKLLFKTRYKINVKENKKAYLRLEAECDKLKKVMSSNSVEIPMAIDNYVDDKDVVGRMKR